MVTEELFRSDSYQQRCRARVVAVTDNGFCTDQTVFYAAAGGQPGDQGHVEQAGQSWAIHDTRKAQEAGRIEHLVDRSAFVPALGSEVDLVLDWPRRHRLMRMHTCLHLLCQAVGGTVTGGSIGDGKGRLDFDIPEPTLDRDAIAAAINGWIAQDLAVRASWVDEAELDRRPELVKTMSVQPPRGHGRIRLIQIDGVDLQACGGTHVARTGEIGPIQIAKIEKKGRQNRRVQLVFDQADLPVP